MVIIAFTLTPKDRKEHAGFFRLICLVSIRRAPKRYRDEANSPTDGEHTAEMQRSAEKETDREIDN